MEGNLPLKNECYVKAMVELGETWSAFDAIFNADEALVCHLYRKKGQNLDLLRYKLYCAKGGKVDPEALPPCGTSLRLHIVPIIKQLSGEELWFRIQMPHLLTGTAGKYMYAVHRS